MCRSTLAAPRLSLSILRISESALSFAATPAILKGVLVALTVRGGGRLDHAAQGQLRRLREVVEQVADDPPDEDLLALVDVFLHAVAFAPGERRDQILLEDLDAMLLLHRRLDDRGGPVLVHRQEALVEPDVGLEGGLLAEHRREEPQAGDVLAQDGQADRQRRREEQPEAPQSQVQNIAATSRPSAETPVVLP